VPATSHSVSAPTRGIRKHGPGLATSTGAIKVPMTALAIARMHCLPRLSYSDRLSMLGFYLRAGVMSVSPFFFSAMAGSPQLTDICEFSCAADPPIFSLYLLAFMRRRRLPRRKGSAATSISLLGSHRNSARDRLE
jgi:hypothetical protein